MEQNDGFTLEVTMSGLGVLSMKTKSDPKHPSNARFLMLGTRKQSHRHFPTCSFFLDDLAAPLGLTFVEPGGHDHRPDESDENTENAAVILSPSGQLMISLDLTGRRVVLHVGEQGGEFTAILNHDPEALLPDLNGNPPEALDWVPDPISDFGFPLKTIDLSTDDLESGRYVTEVLLPPGTITSRGLLIARDGTLRKTFFDGKPTGALAEQLVWSREKVESLTLFDAAKKPLRFDGVLLRQLGRPPVIRISFSNLPKLAEVGRYGRPQHLELYGLMTEPTSGSFPALTADPDFGDGTTPNGACPPSQVSSSSAGS